MGSDSEGCSICRKGTCGDACCCFTKEQEVAALEADAKKYAEAWVGTNRDGAIKPKPANATAAAK